MKDLRLVLTNSQEGLQWPGILVFGCTRLRVSFPRFVLVAALRLYRIYSSQMMSIRSAFASWDWI